MTNKYFAIIIFLLTLISCENSDYKSDNDSIRPTYGQSENKYKIDDFIKLNEIEIRDYDFWLEMNHSEYEVVVKVNDDGKLIFAEPSSGENYFDLEDGKLEIINRGEFGGALNFIPFDSSLDTIPIWNVPTNFVFNFKGKVYFLVGSYHGGDQGGAIYELKRNKYKFRYQEVLRLDSAPQSVAIYKNKILIVGYKMFTVVEDFNKDNIIEDTFWQSLYPNSMVVNNNEEVYIGMRGGYSKVSLKSKEVKYYQYLEK